MLYPIKILQKAIDEHVKEISRLDNIETESYGAEIFRMAEIMERNEYIKKLTDAVSILDKTAVPLVKLKQK